MPDNFHTRTLPGPLGPKPFAADFNGSVQTQPLVLYTDAGVAACYLWVSAAKLYGKFSATPPANATDGVIIGTQT